MSATDNQRHGEWAARRNPQATRKLLDRLEKFRPAALKIEFVFAIAAVFFSSMNFLRYPAFYITLSDVFIAFSLFILLITGRLSLRGIGAASTVWWLIGLSVLLSTLLLSSLVNGDALRGLILVVQYLFAYFFVFLFAAGRSQTEITRLVKVYILSILLMCLHGIYLIYVDGQTNTIFVSGSGRLTGFIERENECAAVIALSVPLLLVLCATGRLTRLAYLALPVMGLGVMLTGSNTGLASIAYAVGVFCLVAFGWKRLLPVGLAAVGGVAAIDYWARDYLPAAFQRRVLGALESGDIGQAGSFDHRLELIEEAIGRADHIVFLGLGADQYQVTSFLEQPVHNLYLLLWTEGGLFCMAGFILMTGAGLGPALTALRYPGGRYFAACAFCSVTLFLLTTNAFAHVYGRFWAMPVLLSIAFAHAFNVAMAQATHSGTSVR
ncbi:O-antigen ligase family protein [Rhizobium sp. TRM95111]|uniref:O-antigen ligase family protein n=1 Tax=Rhizobium alarense TaxID=2846851 RepID=UPI001F2EC41E|nr:O-antigen ligase family protein [Rhizobium alarense]MCF3641821.1 O-antigen ligase family protein [Rhizobium alarense]